MGIDPAKIHAEEKRSIEAYREEHKIDQLVQGLVDSLLRDRPDTRPKEHFAHLLRMRSLKEQAGLVTDLEMMEAAKASEVPGRLLVNLFQATKNISAEIVPKETINIIIRETIKLLQCDRVSLFIYDKRIDMLVLNASNLEHPIRVRPGQGIAGRVFTTHEMVNIHDCYQDARFDQTFDKATGYRTRNLLTMPILDFEGECMGVLQAINKEGTNHFGHVDEIVMENLTQLVSVALRNAEIYRAAIVQNERANALLHMIQSLSQDLGVQSMILTITMHANELVQADRCAVFLVDEKTQTLWSVSTDSGTTIKIPKSAGIAGECATDSKLIAIPDAYQDSRFNQDVDKDTGYHTKSILAVPIVRRHNTQHLPAVLAVIQMINKTEFDGEIGKFDDEDIQVMETFATFVGSKLETSALLAPQEVRESEASRIFSPKSPNPRGSMKAQPVESFAEEDEEEEDA